MKPAAEPIASLRPHIGESSLFRNAALNLTGLILPTLVALFAIPLCVRVYGQEQFGLLSLAWTFIVSFAYLDLGLGVSTTKFTAELLRKGQDNAVPSIIWSSIVMNFGAGAMFSLVVALFAPDIAGRIIAVSPVYHAQTVAIIRYTAFCIPFITTSAALRGVMEASNRFDVTNGIKIPSSSLLFLIPAVGALLSLSISDVVLLLLASRITAAATFFLFAVRQYPATVKSFSFEPARATTLLKFGGWVGVSTLLSPVIHQGEKILIPALLSVTALSYYTPPFEMIARIAVIPFSLAIALLPKFSYLGKKDTLEHREQMIVRPLKYLLLVMTPISAFFVFFSAEILNLWLGPTYAAQSSTLLVILACAYFFNALAYVAYSAIHGLGHPEMKTKLDMVLAPAFILFSWLLINRYGLTGASMAKFIVLSLDAVCLIWFLKNILKLSATDLFHTEIRLVGLTSIAVLLIGLLLYSFSASVTVRLLGYVASVVLIIVVFFTRGSSPDELDSIRSRMELMRFFPRGVPIADEPGAGIGVS